MEKDYAEINQELFLFLKDSICHMTESTFFYDQSPAFQYASHDGCNRKAYTFLAHRHPYPEMFVILNGLSRVNIENMQSLAFPGSIGFIAPDVFHNIEVVVEQQPYRILWIAIDKDKFRMHISQYQNDTYEIADCLDLNFSSYLLDQLKEELSFPQHDSFLYAQKYIDVFFSILYRNYVKHAGLKPHMAEWHIRFIHEIEEYIEEHLTDKITLQEIANEMRLSPSYTSELFKKHKGINLFEYITVRRIEMAKDLLSGTMNVAEISDYLGFQNQSYFSKVFKKHTGISPSSYRQQT